MKYFVNRKSSTQKIVLFIHRLFHFTLAWHVMTGITTLLVAFTVNAKPSLLQDKASEPPAETEADILWNSSYVCFEEKIDGANAGMVLGEDGHPIIRNRDHILTKGYLKDTPAKLQFRSIFNWFYDHKKSFEKLQNIGPYSVYGDWMYMAHGMQYDLLPSLFVTYDLYQYDVDKFVDSTIAREILADCGFTVIQRLEIEDLTSDKLIELANESSQYVKDGKREGIYVKVSDGQWITHRFKLVREDFVQGALFSDVLVKNKVK